MNRVEESSIDIIVTTEADDLGLEISKLISSASRQLHTNGILLIALPIHHGWETLWLAARILWSRWNGKHARFWSRQRLSTMLESCGFTILESIKVRALPDQRQAIVLVARKTSESGSISAS